MPQSLDEQRNLMQKWFGDIDIVPPLNFLLVRGYTETAGMIHPPTHSHSISDYEWECIAFLCDEWDFGFTSKKDSLR